MSAKLEQKDWNLLREETEIYEVKLPTSIDSLPEGKEEAWENKVKDRWGSSPLKVVISATVKVWTNPKVSVKVIVAGKEKLPAIISRNAHRANGFKGLELNRWDEPSDIFDNLKKGTWVVAVPHHWKKTSFYPVHALHLALHLFHPP